MCGICGTFPKRTVSEMDSRAVRDMTDALTHRGPDSAGYFEDANVSIGMRRLSIIDLEGGRQPLYNEDRSLVLMANGEIYNYVELRETLTHAGHRFATESDCETIVHAYEEYGQDFLSHLRGMFAFCLYDTRNKRVILARDRLGEKPLYIYESDDSILFSSELKSLIKTIPSNERRVDQESLYLYLYYGYVPEPRSILHGIRRLPPGHYADIDLDTRSVREVLYWNPEEAPTVSNQPVSTLREEIDRVEEIVIRSDVPVGVSLSGGIDSSVVAALAARYSRVPLHAFSVGYPGYPENDERKAAAQLAANLGFTFHDVEVTEADFLRDFDTMIAAMDDPIADIAAYGYYAVSRKAHESGVPVLLAGFGGDELFWGYGWTRRAAALNSLKKSFPGKILLFSVLVKNYWRNLARAPLSFLSLLKQALSSTSVFLYELTPAWSYARTYERRIFSKAFLDTVERNLPSAIMHDSSFKIAGLSITKLLKDIWLISNCINLGDRMSMAHSVELRLPLVDYRLYEITIGLRKTHPEDYRRGYKFWLIEATKDLLSLEIISRRKRGFTPPTTQWTLSIIDRYASSLAAGYLVSHGIVRKEFIENALTNRRRHMKFLYAIIVFEVFAKHYLP